LTDDLDQARDKVLMGVERRSLTMTEPERITCSYHEAGHAVVAALLPGADPLHKVTIIPRGRALGVTMQLPEGDRHTHTREFLEAQIAILMGGRIAEELFLRQMTSGAGNDISEPPDRAPHGVRVRHVDLSRSPTARQYVGPGEVGINEATAQRVDEEYGSSSCAAETARRVVAKNRSARCAQAEGC
jgi:ATP-dependent Zn protease